MFQRIEIDITYSCSLSCINCNRMCRQAPSTQSMRTDQIYRFVNESVEKGIKWDHIRILGGEPTLHPDLNDMLLPLDIYQNTYSPLTNIIIFTNNYTSKTKQILKKIPHKINLQPGFSDSFTEYKQLQGVIIADHWTKSPAIPNNFVPINMAPKDDPEFKDCDFSSGCKQINECGIGFTPFGFYPCAVAGAIDRVVGFDLGVKELDFNKIMSLNSIFCPLCGMFKESKDKLFRTTEEQISPTWIKILDDYKSNGEPKLTPF